MTKARTRNSVYCFDGKNVMLESGTPSGHLPFGQWVEVEFYGGLAVGQQLRITYLDGLTRTTTAVLSIEESNVGQSSS